MCADWRDLLNREIFPFVEYEGYADKYPTKSMERISTELAEELRYVSGILFGALGSLLSIKKHLLV